MPLFGPKTKSPQDLVKSLKESLNQLAKERGEKEAKKVGNSRCLSGEGVFQLALSGLLLSFFLCVVTMFSFFPLR